MCEVNVDTPGAQIRLELKFNTEAEKLFFLLRSFIKFNGFLK